MPVNVHSRRKKLLMLNGCDLVAPSIGVVLPLLPPAVMEHGLMGPVGDTVARHLHRLAATAIADGGGFYMRLSANGTRSWIFR